MAIPTPNLDDRDFLQLLQEAVERVRTSSSEWTDLGPGDPGMTLLEAFAHLTEVMIYRLNRVPEKAYRSYLNLIGVQLRPPQAARATLLFSRGDSGDTTTPVYIPRGTRVGVASGSGEQIVFVVTQAAAIRAGQDHLEVPAYHCETVDAELVGVTTGEPGQVLRVAHPPMVRTAEDQDLIVAVQVAADEPGPRGPALEHEGVTYRIWQEVDDFADVEPDAPVYVADRIGGTITFAPAIELQGSEAGGEQGARALGRVPGPGLNVRVWYRTGGGAEGNVAPATLTALLDGVADVTVTNPARATGGRPAESVDNAVVRGPHEFHARDRAVTARDYELIAGRSGAVSRACAFTRSETWSYAPRGSVEVVIVPHVEPDARPDGRVTGADLDERSTPETLSEVTSHLQARRPLGVGLVVRWVKVKAVTVRARVGIQAEEDELAFRHRVLERLHRTINPLPAGRRVRASQGQTWPGWPFGQSLRVSDVYDILLAEPGVMWADRVRLQVDAVPGGDVTVVAADAYQPSTWYAASGGDLFRSLNDAVGWEPLWRFEGQTVTCIEPYPREPGRLGLGRRPGFLAVATHSDDEQISGIYVSTDLGETWGDPLAQFAFPIEDLAWIQREETPTLLLATEQGLYEQALAPGATANFNSVEPDEPDLGFYRVVAYTQPNGNLAVALAAQRTRGVYLSRLEGRAGTFVASGLRAQDLRSLAVQYEGTATFLWAGTAAQGGDDPGQGCFRARLEDEDLAWESLADGWEGGSCWAIVFLGDYAYGASHRAGVQRFPLRGQDRRWWRPAVDCGLPLREVGRFHPVSGLAVDPETSMLLAGGPAGVHRSASSDERAAGEEFEPASRAEFEEAVTLPPTWLFVSGVHDVEVITAP